MPGRMRSRNSTTVTSAPSRRQTEPSSSPITPAPTTISDFGGFGQRQRAGRGDDLTLVDLDPRQAGDVGAGGDDDRLGLVGRLGAVGADDHDVAGRRDAPSPCSQSILFFLNRKATPLTLAATVSSLCFIIARRSSLGGATTTPSAPSPWPASSNISEAYSSAFEGMQPMLRQVPPSVLRFSTTATFMPSCAARIAQT